MDTLVRSPEQFGLDHLEAVALLARWREAGWLDGDFRCRARLIPRGTNTRVLTGPLATHFLLTRACNLRCAHCFAGVRARPEPGELTTAQVLTAFADLEELGSPVVVLTGGEPLLRPDLPELLLATRRHGLDAWLCTNATLVDDQRADQLATADLRGCSVSLDGPDPETHDALRGQGRFLQALRGIRLLISRGAPPIQLRVTVTPCNADRLADFGALATELGVRRVVFKPFRMTGAASSQRPLYISQPEYERAAESARGKWPAGACVAEFGDGLTGRAPSWTGIIPAFGCVGGTTTATVTSRGAVVACGSVLSEQDWTLADRSFREIWWRSPSIETWRRLQPTGKCRSCERLAPCGGGCRARALAACGTLADPDPWISCPTR